MKLPGTRPLDRYGKARDANSISGAEAIDRILRHVDWARRPRETVAALINITKLSAGREEPQRRQVQLAGIKRSIRVNSVSAVDGDLKEFLSEIVEEADKPNFVLEEVLLSASKLEVVSVRRRPGRSGVFFRIHITPRDWERRIRVESTGSDHFDINSRGSRRRPHTRPAPPRSALKPQRHGAAKVKRTKPHTKRRGRQKPTHKR